MENQSTSQTKSISIGFLPVKKFFSWVHFIKTSRTYTAKMGLSIHFLGQSIVLLKIKAYQEPEKKTMISNM